MFKKLLVSVAVLVYTFYILPFTFPIHAQVPNPPIACDKVGNPEFNSLRPNQASATCNTQIANYASYCGNDLTFKDSITVQYPGSSEYQTGCSESNGKVYCTYVVPVTIPKLTIDLSEAELPIMGNTEDIKNSQSNDDSLTQADRMSGYVSWYLNGVVSRAEYGTSKNTDFDLVNFSGPIQKLLPENILQSQRILSIDNAGSSNHNQIVVCGQSNIPIIGNPLGLGSFTPTECYDGNGTKAKGKVFRLKSQNGSNGWDGDLSLFTSVTNIVSSAIDSIAGLLPPSIPRNLIESSIQSAWNKKIPPLPWSDENGQPFASEVLYRKAYNEWKGKACVIVPVFETLVCFENILVPNMYADLFSYVPLSSTEDLKGKIKIDSVSSANNSENNGATLTNVTFSNQKPADLFFSHMSESNQLGSLLQDTYTSKGLDKTGNPTNIASEVACESIEVRSNAGDDLFANQITGTLKYTANFTCEYNSNNFSHSGGDNCHRYKGDCYPSDWNCETVHKNLSCGGDFQCGKNCEPPIQECTKNVYIKLSTQSSTPEVDSIWSRLVAGPMAVFKRIFPKTNVEGSVGQIMDIAGSTNITYTGTNITQDSTDLKLPHLGGISEYFLKGIQTALRPKGFGESIEFAPNQVSETPSTCGGTMPTLPTSQGACVLKSGNLTIPPTLKAIIEAAAQQYNTPPGLIVAIMYGEGLFDGGNKKDWTEENVKAWATCTKVPGCSETGDDHFMGFVGSDWNDPKNAILADLKKLDPSKTTADRCNLLDAIYGLAWNLHDSADGNGGLPATCFGIKLSAPVPSSCSWTPEQYESAIKVSESGYTSYCHTKENSCVTGGGNAAACPGGDNCETVSNRYSRPSHNACIWDIAHRY